MKNDKKSQSQSTQNEHTLDKVDSPKELQKKEETGGPEGLEPTRYGDWERKGRCIDF